MTTVTVTSRLPGTAIRPTGPGDLCAAIGKAGHQAVIKPKPVRPAVEGGFAVDDFTAGAAAGTVTRPAGA